MFDYPLGRKCEAFLLGVQLILLYFIRISLLYPKTFFYLGVDVGVGVDVDGGLFFFVFKSLENNMVYSLAIGIYICKRNLCRTKFLWV